MSTLATIAVGTLANDGTGDPLRTAFQRTNSNFSTLNSEKVETSSLGAPGGVATLDGSGKVPQSQLPNITITDVFTVNSQAAQLALDANTGDIAIRTDQANQGYIHNGGTSGTMADWTSFATGGGGNMGTTTYDPAGIAQQVVGLTATQTLTNKTLTSPIVNTATITGGTVNNAVIGGTTPAVGNFTELVLSGSTLGLRSALNANTLVQFSTADEIRLRVNSQNITRAFYSGTAGHFRVNPSGVNIDFAAYGATGNLLLEVDASLDTVNINGNVGGTAILDEDNMASNSATKLATQQSIKAYVDAQVALISGSATSFTSSKKSSVGFVNEFLGKHDASAGAIPSYTTAKKGDLIIVSVAGTYNGTAVARGDLLHANQDNPTTLAHWNIIQDCASEVTSSTQNFGRSRMKWSEGVYLVNDVAPASAVNWDADKDTVTVLTKLDSSALDHSTGAESYSAANTFQADITTITLEDYTDSQNQTTDYVSVLNCTTPSEAANYTRGMLVKVTCNLSHVYTAASLAKAYLGEEFLVMDSDPTTGKVYANKKLRWHRRMAALTGSADIKLNSVPTGRPVTIRNMTFTAAPTLIGNSAGWWDTGYGDIVTATISSSVGTSRTITSAGHNLVAGNVVRMGVSTSAADMDTCFLISSVTTNTFTVTVPTYKDTERDGNNDPVAATCPTSGTIYYQPVFDRRNGSTNSATVTLRNRPYSLVENCKFDRIWVMGIRAMHTSYSTFRDNDFLKMPNTITNNLNTNGRIGYSINMYGTCTGTTAIGGMTTNGRHMTTTGCAEESSYSATFWYRRGQPTDIEFIGMVSWDAWGPPVDTHEEANGVLFKDIRVYNPRRGPFEGSYAGYGAQVRCANVRFEGYVQEGGNYGIRIAASEQPDSIIYIEAKVSNLTDNGNDSAALRIENQASYTNRPVIYGSLEAYNCGWGIYAVGTCKLKLDKFSYRNVSERAISAGNGSEIHIDNCTLDFSDNVDSLTFRYPIYMTGTSKVTLGTCVWTQGAEADQPPCLFFNSDAAAGKTVGIGNLIYRDPSGVGPTPLMSAGHEALFTWEYGGDMLALIASDETTTITTGDSKIRYPLGRAFLLIEAIATLNVASSSGTVTMDVKSNGVSIFGDNKLFIEAGETTSRTAATKPSYSTMVLPEDAVASVQVVGAGSGAAGAKVTLRGFWV